MKLSLENDTEKKPIVTTDPKQAQKLSALWDDVIKDRSFIGIGIKFLSNPFILLGGFIVAIYFLPREVACRIESLDKVK